MGRKNGKRYSPKFKFNVVLEVLKTDKSGAEVARAFIPWREGANRLGVGLLFALPAAIVVGLLIAPVDVWWKLQWGILLVLAGFFAGPTLSSMSEYVLWRIMPRALDATPCPRCDGALRWPEEARGEIPCPRCGTRGFAVCLEFHR